ncbi:MAG: toll/interleukin-1 receptor domain-containing protein [Clostridia bacterium]|nr:toll/interleukin-1 receptor domain-containing protein [Clostridia bacterium]
MDKRTKERFDLFDSLKGEIFFSYKKTDNEGKLTDDRDFVKELVYHLRERGYNVFFAEENLQNYAGKEWEDELYKALNRAQVCIVYCSKKEYFTSKWVSKEWNTFKDRIKNEKDKQLLLIPIYDDVKALPEELNGYQGFCCGDRFFIDKLTKSLNRFFKEREFGVKFELSHYNLDEEYLKENCLDYLTSLSLAETDVKYRFSLGCCYYLGLGIKKDLKRAFYWWERSAKQVSSQVCYFLATYYLLGVENFLEPDYEKGLEFLYSSATQNFALVQNTLGECYYFGEWLSQDYDKAVEWYTKSAEQGYDMAQCYLGVCYEFGNGIEQDYKKAVEWYTKSAEQGYARAQCNLGVCYYIANGVKKDYKKAIYWYTKSAEQGNVTAQFNLGVCYEFGEGVEQDYVKAVEWYTKSAEQGYDMAQCNLGYCYEFGKGVEQDYAKAVEWYTKSAEQCYKDSIKALKRLKKKI